MRKPYPPTVILLQAMAAAAAFMGVLLALLDLQATAYAGASRGAPASQASGPLVLDVQSITKTLAGRVITYTLFVTSNTDTPLSNVVITDAWGKQDYNGNYQATGVLLGASATYVTATAQPYMRWTLSSLPGRATGSIVMTMWISAALQPAAARSPIILPNVAAITHSTSGIAGSQDAFDSLVIGPVISFTKSYTPAFVRPGRLMTYVLRVENLSDSLRPDAIAGTGMSVRDKVPSYADLWEATGGSAVEYAPATRIITWRLGDPFAPGTTSYLTLTLRLSETLKNGPDVSSKIRNMKADYSVEAHELPLPIQGDANIIVTGEDVLEKAAEAGPPPPGPAGSLDRTFPNRVITYYVAVYNPLNQPLSGFRITDTLPQYPSGGPYFQYLNTFAVPPYAPPTVVTATGRTVAWEAPAVAAWGVYTFGLRVLVPPQMDTRGTTGRIYDNALRGEAASIPSAAYDNLTPDEAQVRVMPQIILNKTANPTRQLPGQPVVYTLTAANAGDTPIGSLRLTDTLPGLFSFVEMINGPSPIITTPSVAWQPITLSAFSTATLVYRTIADGMPLMNHCSTIYGYSPHTFVPSQTREACVYVLSPFRLDKTASPSSFALGQNFNYIISILNVGTTAIDILSLGDDLPPGFYSPPGGASVQYREWFTPPVSLAPGDLPFERSFTAEARTAPRNECNRLPGYIPQAPMSVFFETDTPPLEGTWYNASNIGAAYVSPHVGLAVRSSLPGAKPGGPVTYTFVLTNNTSQVQPQIVITAILPSGFQYQRMVDYTAPDQIVPGTNPKVIWRNVTVPASGILSFSFVALADLQIGENKELLVQVTSAADPNVCVPWLGGGDNAWPGPKIDVRHPRLVYTKTVTPAQVSRLGLVAYNVTVYNKGPYPVSGAIVTDVLPSHPSHPDRPFQFVVMRPPVPPGVTLVYTQPPAWRIASLDADKSITFSFYAEATNYAGINYRNVVTGAPNVGWVVEPDPKYGGAPVEVLGTIAPFSPSDLVISKTVSRPTAVPGGRITFTLAFTNMGPYAASSVVITEYLSALISNPAVASAGAAITPVSGSRLAWRAGTLNVGAWGVITISGILSVPLRMGTYTNAAEIGTLSGLDPLIENNASVAVYTVPNVAPVLRPIGSQVVKRGASLSFTAAAADGNGDAVTYSLGAGAPAGASINGATGYFTWTPSAAQQSSVHILTVRATDTGAPPLSGAETFTVSFASRFLHVPVVRRNSR